MNQPQTETVTKEQEITVEMHGQIVPSTNPENREILQDERGRFLKGTAPGPGRPAGRYARKIIDVIFGLAVRPDNLGKIQAHLQQQIDNAPGKFLTKFVYPLLPKSAQIQLSSDNGDGPIKIILGVAPQETRGQAKEISAEIRNSLASPLNTGDNVTEGTDGNEIKGDET